jgi:outer membrane protein
MKYLVSNLAIAAGLLLGGAAHGQSMVKIGSVDMKKVFDGYYKTKDAEGRINEARNSAKKELEERMEGYQKSLAEVKKLNEEIENPALSRESKETKAKSRDEKVGELRNLEREIQEFRTTREKQLQEQSNRMRQGIVEEISKLVNDKVKADAYDLVVDKSGMSLNGVPVVMFAKDSYDFTDDIVAALNKNKPTDAPKATEKPAEKPAEKKK